MIEQRTIIDHEVYFVMIHDGEIDTRIESIAKPMCVDGIYIADIPNFTSRLPVIVNKDSEIKTVYFNIN